MKTEETDQRQPEPQSEIIEKGGLNRRLNYQQPQQQPQQQEQEAWLPALHILILSTVTMTVLATIIMCMSIMTDHWENITWDLNVINDIVTSSRNISSDRQVSVESFLDDLVVKISVYDFENSRPTKSHQNCISYSATTTKSKLQRQNEQSVSASPLSENGRISSLSAAIYLLPMHGGIWTLCISLADHELRLLRQMKFPKENCINYLSMKLFKEQPTTINWNHRMQNLSISCALVCLIILASSAIVGIFAILKHQLSAVLITGVMYLLAATFAIFTLLIIHFKQKDRDHRHTDYNCLVGNDENESQYLFRDGVIQATSNAIEQQYTDIWSHYYSARKFSLGWSVELGWIAVSLSILASIFWLSLTKVMRNTPPTFTIT